MTMPHFSTRCSVCSSICTTDDRQAKTTQKIIMRATSPWMGKLDSFFFGGGFLSMFFFFINYKYYTLQNPSMPRSHAATNIQQLSVKQPVHFCTKPPEKDWCKALLSFLPQNCRYHLFKWSIHIQCSSHFHPHPHPLALLTSILDQFKHSAYMFHPKACPYCCT